MLTLDEQTAQRIVDRTMQAIGWSVNVMTPDGIIIASGEPRRVGDHHEAAKLVASSGHPLIIDDSRSGAYSGTRPGVNLPVTVGGEMAAVVGISGAPEEVSQYADLVRITAELMLEQAALLEAGQHRRRQIEDVLLAACEGKTVPEIWFEQLGIEADCPRIGLILEATTQVAVEQVLVPLAPYLEQHHRAALAVRLSPRQLLIFAETGPGQSEFKNLLATLAARGKDDVILATGKSFTRNFVAGYQSATATLEVGRRRKPGASILRYEELRIPALWQSLAPHWQQAELQALIEPLVEHRQGELYLKTLSRYIDCDGEIKRCADQLNIHPNTVRYRLQKIEALTRLSPFVLRDLLVLQFALETR